MKSVEKLLTMKSKAKYLAIAKFFCLTSYTKYPEENVHIFQKISAPHESSQRRTELINYRPSLTFTFFAFTGHTENPLMSQLVLY